MAENAENKEPKVRAGGMSVREAGQKGGETVKNKYGAQFYEQIGRKGGLATKLAHGHEFYEQIGKKGGKKGGEATRDRYGPNFYERIGQKGGQKVKQLIEEGYDSRREIYTMTVPEVLDQLDVVVEEAKKLGAMPTLPVIA